MATYYTKEGQNIWDVSIQLYGSDSSTVQLLLDNPALGYVGKRIPAGTAITYTAQAGNAIADFFTNKEIDPNTGLINDGLAGSGFDSGFKINGFN